jgi:hypothetical protein
MTTARREESPGRRARLVLALLVAAGVAGAPAVAAGTCASRDDLVGPCFRMRGRAALYNGNPTVRIWRVGTKRLLGVSASRCEPPACEPLPAELRTALDWEHPVFADFALCPLTRRRPGVMQMVCIAAVTNLRRGSDPSH